MASRRDFFTAFRKPADLISDKASREDLIVRPPYGSNESLFQSECPSCESQACVTSCEQEIIIIRADKTPMLNFNKTGCTFCEDCAEACPVAVLTLDHHHTAQQINASFRISTEGCVAHHGVVCFSCKEPCIDDAILFNGMFNPVIDDGKCTGCGYCLGRCPTQAITYLANEIATISNENIEENI
ncbi:MAG: ferredoxin-type protein NapF [Campylobacterota bacterium]|nr:ferredoxin-type protein NapF [Campylobacterota bacterium]